MIKIIKPSIGGHDGSSFRELLDMWAEKGLCTVEMGPAVRSSDYDEDPDSPEAKCWIEKQGNILLYDFPILDRLKNDYKMCLFSNMYAEGEKNKKWIFWPRWSRFVDENKEALRNLEKTERCVFVGRATNTARNSIAGYWSRACDVFSIRGNLNYSDYMTLSARSHFGLCLPGVGPKCLRDVEYMAVGTIPVVVDYKAVKLYHNPPVEGEHYIYANSVEEAKCKMDDLLANPQDMKRMSQNCIEWFEENCSVNGSFKTTMEIIEKFND